ncbi:MAG: PHB depolymerase family esterase [Candidatus Accumulibacter phosphatis]|jgi:poly(hydroxyalkanoate) depolymerase family esterase|uniref:PHB depolymerase family esterase n=1 Tax=Candidatus Accumulibacter contiguus TaxID=2954381 RepID=A0ABX1TE85_9PROT|nr:PHB depolymerase family esterase [Candidatus Accumulibacter contiguus]NMQ07127.1 PHB depolymerase family esterase [Candidatus Accumulibacter contiguus]
MNFASVGNRKETAKRVSTIVGRLVVLAVLAQAPIQAATAQDAPAPLGSTTAKITEIEMLESRNPGALKMFVYVPESVRSSAQPRPLVVALHGCAMTAEDYLQGTGWAQLAEKWGFAVLLPQQQKARKLLDFFTGKNNPALCFNWWEADRGNAEVRSIMHMIKRMLDDYGSRLDPSRIYATGVSAGGGMTVDLLALHPTCFAGGAPIAGVAFNCAELLYTQAINSCMQPTDKPGPKPRQSREEGGRVLSKDNGANAKKWGYWVRRICEANKDCPSSERGWPPITIWQGEQDRMVGPGNLRDLALQWTNVHGFNKQNPGKRTVTVKVPPYEVEHTQYADKTGRVLVETRLIGKEGPATDHGVVIDPEEASFACGRTQDFVYDGNICSTLEIARFWGLDSTAATSTASDRCSNLK